MGLSVAPQVEETNGPHMFDCFSKSDGTFHESENLRNLFDSSDVLKPREIAEDS